MLIQGDNPNPTMLKGVAICSAVASRTRSISHRDAPSSGSGEVYNSDLDGSVSKFVNASRRIIIAINNNTLLANTDVAFNVARIRYV